MTFSSCIALHTILLFTCHLPLGGSCSTCAVIHQLDACHATLTHTNPKTAPTKHNNNPKTSKNAIMENFRSQWHQFKRNDMANVRATSKYIHRLCVCRMPARLLICLCNCFICWADKFYLFALRWIENRDNESADDNLMGSNVFGCAARHDNRVCAHFSGHNS